jgi:hypothetical protein
MSVQLLYDREVRPLACVERIELAALIVRELPADAVPGYCDEWSDQAMDDFAQAAFPRAERAAVAAAS